MTQSMKERLLDTKLIPINPNQPKYGKKLRVPNNPDGPEAVQEIERLEAERDSIAGSSIWWSAVIGGTHQPSGELPSIKHLHPAMVKPVYDAHKGTAVADVIAGLIFKLAITENREQFLVRHANERAEKAEAALLKSQDQNDV